MSNYCSIQNEKYQKHVHRLKFIGLLSCIKRNTVQKDTSSDMVRPKQADGQPVIIIVNNSFF